MEVKMIENPHINPDWWVDPPETNGCSHDDATKGDNVYHGLNYCETCYIEILEGEDRLMQQGKEDCCYDPHELA